MPHSRSRAKSSSTATPNRDCILTSSSPQNLQLDSRREHLCSARRRQHLRRAADATMGDESRELHRAVVDALSEGIERQFRELDGDARDLDATETAAAAAAYALLACALVAAVAAVALCCRACARRRRKEV